MTNRIYPVLLCGGSGTRLWPLSRKSHPKQFVKLLGEESLLQSSARRLSGTAFAALSVAFALAPTFASFSATHAFAAAHAFAPTLLLPCAFCACSFTLAFKVWKYSGAVSLYVAPTMASMALRALG